MIINKMKRSEKHVNRVQKLMHLLLPKERKNLMVLLTTINLFLLTKQTQLEANWMVLIAK